MLSVTMELEEKNKQIRIYYKMFIKLERKIFLDCRKFGTQLIYR